MLGSRENWVLSLSRSAKQRRLLAGVLSGMLLLVCFSSQAMAREITIKNVGNNRLTGLWLPDNSLGFLGPSVPLKNLSLEPGESQAIQLTGPCSVFMWTQSSTDARIKGQGAVNTCKQEYIEITP